MSSSLAPTQTRRIALVTGAANFRGIGRAIALRLADDGLDVAVNDVETKSESLESVADEIRPKGVRSVAICADVASEDSVNSLIGRVVNELGGLDVAVANAGVLTLDNILNVKVEDFDRHLAVNVRGVMLVYKHAGAAMVKQGRGGRLIAASSIAGKSGLPFAASYSASKFAVRGLTQSAAQELAPHNITVNAYAPGYVVTDMTDGIIPTPGTATAYPDVVASYVSYITKPESYFITGQSININGGTWCD